MIRMREIATGQEHRQRSGRQDHAALETAAGGELTVHDDVDPDRDQARDQHEREGAQGIARARELMLVGLLLVRSLVLVAELAEDQHDAERPTRTG